MRSLSRFCKLKLVSRFRLSFGKMKAASNDVQMQTRMTGANMILGFRAGQLAFSLFKRRNE